MKKFLIALAVIMGGAVATPAWATEVQNHQCDIWLSNHDYRDGHSLNEWGADEDDWLAGFVNGALPNTGPSILGTARFWVADYCGQHPQATLYAATVSIIPKLEEGR